MTFVDSCALLSCRFFSNKFIKTKLLSVLSLRFHMDIKDEKKSAMEIVNVPPLVSTYRQAMETFDPRNSANLPVNLGKLKTMMDGLRQEHFGFDQTLNDPATWKRKHKAPCTYIEVYQDSQVNMSIFVLRPGFKMPLHDHPHMHGLLKVISGAVQIRSFSEYPLTQNIDPAKFELLAKEEAKRLASGSPKKRTLFAEISKNSVCAENSQTCVLTPTLSNYHEIQALDTPAAFFDILSPPYDTLIEEIGPRRCSYYTVSEEIATNVVQLTEDEMPDCFYCDQAPYLGPTLH